jgi:hypothetical protein
MVAPRISPAEARDKMQKGQALLVCAYDDEAKCAQIRVDGSMSFKDFQGRLSSFPRNQEIIFY